MNKASMRVLLIILLPLFGCAEEGGYSTVPELANHQWDKVMFSGHVYVRWTGVYKGGIVHDPDCPCRGGR